MSDFETSGKQVFGVLFIGFGIMLSFLGGISLLGGVGELWWVMFLLLISGLLMLFGGITNLHKAKAAKKNEREIIRQIDIQDKIAISPQQEIKQLASWSVDVAYWNKFSAMENQTRKIESIGVFIGMAVFGTLLLLYKKGAGIIEALVMVVMVFAVYLLISRVKTNNYLRTNKKEVRCIFLERGAVINGQYQAFWDDERWMSRIEQKREQEILFLEITLNWNTRDGEAHDELRVPYYVQDEEKANHVYVFYQSKIIR